jgi:hypothetical protein
MSRRSSTVIRCSASVPVLSVSMLLIACASAPDAGPPSSAAGGSCSAEAQRAAAPVLAVVERNGACATDADCTTVGLSTRCFDVCSRAVAASGVPEVEAALASADADGCEPFIADGCQLIVPPCVPPTPPVCRAGSCE